MTQEIVKKVESDFRKRVKKLKPPSSSDFDQVKWKDAFDNSHEKTSDDTSLLITSVWLGAEAKLSREYFGENIFKSVDSSTAIKLGISTANQEYRFVSESANESIRESANSGILSFTHLASNPIKTALAGQMVSPDDIIASLVDAIESWIFDASNIKHPIPQNENINFSEIRRLAYYKYVFQRGINDRWNQCLWEDIRIFGSSDNMLWAPKNIEYATLKEAWHYRQMDNSMSYAWMDIFAWSQLSPKERRRISLDRSVIEYRDGKRRRFRIGTPTYRSIKPHQYIIEKASIESSYLSIFLDTPFPKKPNLNSHMLLKAWNIISDSCRLMNQYVKKHENIDKNNIDKISLCMRRHELIKILSESMKIEKTTSDDIITFLTYTPKIKESNTKGVWSNPIIEIPNSDQIAFILPVINTSNSVRRMEGWLQRGGLDDNLSISSKGETYESEFRNELKESLRENSILTENNCAISHVNSRKKFKEEIDLLIKLGNKLIVGEVKCWIFPAEPLERYNHEKKIISAAKQANNKAKYCSDNLTEVENFLSQKFDKNSQDFEIIPIVVTNHGYGVSATVDGCLISDARILSNYLSGGEVVTEAATNTKTRHISQATTTIYRSEIEASANFKKTISNPYFLRKYLDRIHWDTTPLPSFVFENLQCAIARIGDFTGRERQSFLTLKNIISNEEKTYGFLDYPTSS